MVWRLRKDTPGPLKTVMERLKRISLIPILRQVLYLGGFLCRSAPLAVVLLPFPLLGEPAVDPDPAY